MLGAHLEDVDFIEDSLLVNMASPMQDTVISSTVTSVNSPFYDNEQNLHGNTIEDLPLRKFKVCSKTSHCLMRHSKDCCSWMTNFDQNRHRLAGSINYTLFKHFLTVYAENVTKDAFIWKTKPSKLTCVKKHISNVLMFYHWYYCIHKEKIEDPDFYLQKMSDILLVYLNLELKLLKRVENDQTPVNKISNTLINKIWIYLDKSEKHIFTTLFKSKLFKKQYSKVCSAVLKKCFTDILVNKPKITDITYVRYIIALKSWKLISDDDEKIENLALKVLGPTIPSLNIQTLDFFPLPPKKCMDHTLWYLKTKTFDLDNILVDFNEFETNSSHLNCDNEVNKLTKIENCCHLQINASNSRKILLKRSKLQKQYFLEKKESLKTGEAVFVDLTKEDNHKFDKKSFKRKESIRWLSNVKKKRLSDCLSDNHDVDCENNESSKKKMIDTSISNLPVTEHNVTEPYKVEILHSSYRNCDNVTYNDNLNLSYSNGVFENSELSKDSLILSDLFDDRICDLSIDINLLHKESEKFPFSNFITNTEEQVSFLLDSNLDLASNIVEVVDPCATSKSFEESLPNKADVSINSFQKDSLLINCKDRKHQLLIDVTDFGLLEAKEKTFPIVDEQSLMSSSDVSSNLFISKKNSEIEFDEFSKTPFFDEYFISDNKDHPVSVIDKKDSKNVLERNRVENFSSKELFDDGKLKLLEEKKKIRSSNNLSTSLKKKEASTPKMKYNQLEDKNVLCLNKKKKTKESFQSFIPKSSEEFNSKSTSKFLIDSPLWPSQKFCRSIKTNTFQKLANYIKNSGMNKVITVFDSGSSILIESKNKKGELPVSHYFIRLLFERGLLLRHYTRNKGKLERLVGIVSDKIFTLSDQDIFTDSVHLQVDCDLSKAHFVIFFANNLSSSLKWFKQSSSILFVIQEQISPENKNMHLKSDLDLKVNPPSDQLINSYKKFELIQVDTHDIGCQLLSDELGWSEELKKCGKIV